jgi:hypothetical protein
MFQRLDLSPSLGEGEREGTFSGGALRQSLSPVIETDTVLECFFFEK